MVINRICKKIIHKILVTFLTNNNILTQNQFGFRQRYPTSHRITHLNETIIEHLEKKRLGAALFIDLKSGFDTIGPKILIDKLRQFCGNVLLLVQIMCSYSYLFRFLLCEGSLAPRGISKIYSTVICPFVYSTHSFKNFGKILRNGSLKRFGVNNFDVNCDSQ